MIVVLDLFCCAGGSARGYLDLGVDLVIGVDTVPQPRYAGTHFIQARASGVLGGLLAGGALRLPGLDPIFLDQITFVHASPPCQAWSDLQKQSKRFYHDFIGETRELLKQTNKPWVIENVEGAPLVDPVWLCGANDEHFPELRVIRHRQFESNVPLVGTPCPDKHPLCFTMDKRKSMFGKLDQNTAYVHVNGGGNCTVANKRSAMGVPWMIGREANEAIPPAYARFIGEQILTHIALEERP